MYCVSCRNVTMGIYPTKEIAMESIRQSPGRAKLVTNDEHYAEYESENGPITVVGVKVSTVAAPMW